MSSDQRSPANDIPDNEATVIRSTVSSTATDGGDIRLEYIEKIRNHQLNYQKYHVRDKIAEGGMGSIHKVYDKNLHRSSVLKIILPRIQDDPALFRQFIKEAQITARLEHPNIIPVHDIGVIDGDRLHFAMKEVQGESLATMLRKLNEDGEPGAQEFSYYNQLTVFRKVCDAVAFAHSKGILHRDIKPDNIMVGGFGEVLLMDWGLAKLRDEEEIEPPTDMDTSFLDDLNPEATLSGVVKGSPAFMSPEQAKGLGDAIDERSDVFLLGSTLYFIATLHAPYAGADIEETLANAQQGNLIDLELRNPGRAIPPELSRIIRKAMAIDPDMRYQNVESLIKDIDALLEGNTSATTKVFAPGEIIIREGELGEEAYVISEGEVEVFKSSKNGELHLLTLGQGDVIGEMALISNSVRSASIRAITHTELVMITKEVMEQGLSQLPPWLKTAVNCLTERLSHANQQVHPLINGECTFHILRQIQFSYLSLGESLGTNGDSAVQYTAPTRKVIDDVAANLCIPVARAESAVSTLLARGFISPSGSDRFAIGDLFCYEKLLQLAASEQGLSYTASTSTAKLLGAITPGDSDSDNAGGDVKSGSSQLAEILADLRHRIQSE